MSKAFIAKAIQDSAGLTGIAANKARCNELIEYSMAMVTSLVPIIGYDKASEIAHHASVHDLTLKEAALKLGYVSEAEFDRVVDPKKMVHPYVAKD